MIPEEVKEAAVDIIRNFFQKLFGIQPRGGFAKWERTLGKFCAAQAKLTGYPVGALWFHRDYVWTEPNGRYYVRFGGETLQHHASGVAAVEAVRSELEAAGERFWSIDNACNDIDFEKDSELVRCITFVPHNIPSEDLPAGTPPPGDVPPATKAFAGFGGVAALVVAVVVYIASRKR